MAHYQPGSRSRLPVIRPVLPPLGQASTSINFDAVGDVREDSGDTTYNSLGATARSGGENPTSVRNIGRQLPTEGDRNTGELADLTRAPSASLASHADGQSLSQRRHHYRGFQTTGSLPWLAETHITLGWVRRLQGFQAFERQIVELQTQMNHQQLAMAKELRTMREALLTARRERAEAEEKVQRIGAYIMKLERRLERRKELESKETGQQGEVVRKLHQQVEELEHQLDLLYRNNPIRAPVSAQDTSSLKQQACNILQQVSSQVLNLQDHFQKILCDLALAAAHFNALCSDKQRVNQENLQMQISINAAQRAARQLVETVLQTPMVKGKDVTQLTSLMNVADNDLILDRILLAIAKVMEPQ